MAYHDGGWNVRVAPLMEIEKKYDDVPLADINRVFEAIQNKIEEGNIRKHIRNQIRLLLLYRGK